MLRASAVLAIVLCTLSTPPWALARADVPAATQQDIPGIAVAELPREARETLALIRRGGPFPHQRDGVVFGNFEKHLPLKERGYYHEYTVRMPGTEHRGARRIVTGRNGERYYTDDHYRTFKRIEP
jgi:ribonuclease T1